MALMTTRFHLLAYYHILYLILAIHFKATDTTIIDSSCISTFHMVCHVFPRTASI